MINETKTWKVSYLRAIEYDIMESSDLFDPLNETLVSIGKKGYTHRFVVVDSNIEKYYGPAICNYFSRHNVDIRLFVLPGGETSKTLQSYAAILSELDLFPIYRRDEPIIAIGGGVTTDVVGFAASSYRRGVPHIKIPTTLVGYVDAAVGIKAGVNFNGHKNRLGAFEPPQKVILDKTFLKTLPTRHLLNGVCEILKLAIIKDHRLFEMLESNGSTCVEEKFQDEASSQILRRSIEGMIEELQPNMFEENLSRNVDFGHTFCYGLETACGSELLHGEAVLIDMILSTILARSRNLLSHDECERIYSLILRLGLRPDSSLMTPEALWDSLQERTIHRNGLQRIPLPKGIGKCVFVNNVRKEEVQSAWREFIRMGQPQWQNQQTLNLMK